MTQDINLTHAQWVQRYEAGVQSLLQEMATVPASFLQKILLVTLLDSLAKARDPKTKGDRKRFRGLLDSSSTWEDRNRVSLPQLLPRLDERPDVAPKLADWVRSQVNGWRWGALLPIGGCDPLKWELPRLWEDSASEEASCLIDQAEHGNLLYTYRSYLVHECRQPGDGYESRDQAWPYYWGVHSDGDRLWELVYPLKFFRWLADTTLSNVCNHLLETGIDPYESYDYGPVWRARPR